MSVRVLRLKLGDESLYAFCPQVIPGQQEESELHEKKDSTSGKGDGESLHGGALFAESSAGLAKDVGGVDHIKYYKIKKGLIVPCAT